MQTQEARLLLEQKLEMISQRACGLIGQTLTKAVTDNRISLEHLDVGHGTLSVTSGIGGVSVVQYPGRPAYSELLTKSRSLALPDWEMEIPAANCKIPLLRKLG